MARPPKEYFRRLSNLEKSMKPDSLDGWTCDDLLYAMRYDEAPPGLVMPNFPPDPELDRHSTQELLELARENWLDTFGDEPMPDWMAG